MRVRWRAGRQNDLRNYPLNVKEPSSNASRFNVMYGRSFSRKCAAIVIFFPYFVDRHFFPIYMLVFSDGIIKSAVTKTTRSNVKVHWNRSTSYEAGIDIKHPEKRDPSGSYRTSPGAPSIINHLQHSHSDGKVRSFCIGKYTQATHLGMNWQNVYRVQRPAADKAIIGIAAEQ